MKRVLFPLFGAFAIPALLLACGGDDDDSPATRAPLGTATPTVQSARTPAASPAATKPAQQSQFFDFSKATTTASGLAYIDVAVGNGASPRMDQVVSVHYTGKLASDGKVFDSTAGRDPASFSLTRVIKGFSEGILTMRPGGKRIVYIPAALGYAASPPSGSGIPANADLIFEIELVAVK